MASISGVFARVAFKKAQRVAAIVLQRPVKLPNVDASKALDCWSRSPACRLPSARCATALEGSGMIIREATGVSGALRTKSHSLGGDRLVTGLCSSETLLQAQIGRCGFQTSTGQSGDSADTIEVTFVDKAGGTRTVSAVVGSTILQTAHDNDVELEGACEASCACSTCHVILDLPVYEELPEPSEAEEDMLDMAPCLSQTSRLGCQVTLTKSMDGCRIYLPSITRNFYVDGHVPKPH